MSKSIVISERDNIAAVMENGKAVEFLINRGDMLLGDVYLCHVENILPSIDAAFVNLGADKMGFLHASDVAGTGPLQERLKPKQQLMVQIVKEPTGHKGPRVTTEISLPGRFLVFMPNEKGINVSRKIASAKERARLKSIVSLLKPVGVGVIIRTEAEGQSEAEIQEDIEILLDKWSNIVSTADSVAPPSLLYRDQDLLYRAIREACSEDTEEIVVDTPFALHRANQLLQSWNMNKNIKVSAHKGSDSILVAKGIDKEIKNALQHKINMQSGGYLFMQTTEALTVVDVNSGKFTSSATQNETILKTNLEAAHEIARQLRLRNIGGMIIVDFIDMNNRVDKLAVLEEFELALEPDKSKPQVGQLSDLGLVELTRHRQGQSLAEVFTKKCPACNGLGAIIEDLTFTTPPQEVDYKTKMTKLPKVMQTQKPSMPQSQKTPNVNANINNPNNKNFQHKNQPKIQTTPSVNAQNNIQQKKEENAPDFKFDAKTANKVLEDKGFVPPVSNTIRFAAIPSETARQKINNVNVFTVLQELESGQVASPEGTTPEKGQDIETKEAEVKIVKTEETPKDVKEEMPKKRPVTRKGPVRKPIKKVENAKAETEKAVNTETKEESKPKPKKTVRRKPAIKKESTEKSE